MKFGLCNKTQGLSFFKLFERNMAHTMQEAVLGWRGADSQLAGPLER